MFIMICGSYPEPHQLGRGFLQIELKVLQFMNDSSDPLLIIVVLMETEWQICTS